MYTRVKICGLTRPQDAVEAAYLGAHAIGLVFYEKSPRYVTSAQAQEICRLLPPFVTKVGLFVNASAQYIEGILHEVQLDLLQFHGEEKPEDCIRHQLPYIKAIRVKAGEAYHPLIAAHSQAQGFLFDTYVAGMAGGTGERFDWSLLPKELSRPLILAGGLQASNVAQAIETVAPYAVDVSGGVERSKGIKDPEKIKQFINAVRAL